MAKSQKTKNYQAHEEWMVAKKIGRPKQVWIWDVAPSTRGDSFDPGFGHWEKI